MISMMKVIEMKTALILQSTKIRLLRNQKNRGPDNLKLGIQVRLQWFQYFFFLPMNLTVTKSKKNKFPIVDMEGDVPKNGIESLLKASALTTR